MIDIGSSIRFIAEEQDSSTGEWLLLSDVVVPSKEFNAEEFQGVGYQSVLISDNFGNVVSHGIGFTGESTNLQINNKSLALPLYRFDFAFILDSDRLGLLQELFLLQYNRFAANTNFRLRFQDLRLVVSEPTDVLHSRVSIEEVEDNSVNGWIEKRVEFQITMENFTFDYFQGDLYSCNIVANEATIVTDNLGINICVPADDEEGVDIFEGISVEEIPLPTSLVTPTTVGEFYGMGVNSDGKYFAHAKLDNVDYFFSWNTSNPNATLVSIDVNAQSLADTTLPHSLNPDYVNTRVFDDHIISANRYDPNTENLYVYFDVANNSALAINPDPATNAETNQLFLPIESSFNNFVALPRNLLDIPFNTVDSRSYNTKQIDLVESGGVGRHILAEQIINENDTLFRLLNDASVQNDHLLLSKSRTTTGQDATTKGAIWYRRRVLVGTGTNFEVFFEFQINNNSQTHSPNPADGLCFVMHADPRGFEAIGRSGGGIGYTDFFEDPSTGQATPNFTDPGFQGITPSVAVVFDTWYNPGVDPGPGSGFDPDAYGYGTIAINADMFNATPEVELSSTSGAVDLLDEQRKFCWISYDHDTTTLEVRISDSNTKPVGATFSRSDINLVNILQTDNLVMGFTSATGGADSDHILHGWSFVSNTRFLQGLLGPVTGAEYQTWNGSTKEFTNDYRTNEPLVVEPEELDLVSVTAPFSGSNVYYHKVSDGTSETIYRSNTANWVDSSRTLVFFSATGLDIPDYEHGIQKTDGTFRFFLTQGKDAGTVYVTDDWSTFTTLGVWSEFDASRSNEGQLYPYLEKYIVRNPNRFVLDIETETFVDLETVLCPGQDGTGLFGAGREIHYSSATNPFGSLAGTANEQMIFCSRDDTSQDGIRCFKLTLDETCPVTAVQPNIYGAGLIDA